MAVDDVAMALVDLHDPAIRNAVASGDLSGLRGGNLTTEERELVLNAAAEEPDVEGFDIVGSSYYPGLTYLANNRDQLTPGTRSAFNEFFQGQYGDSWTLALMG